MSVQGSTRSAMGSNPQKVYEKDTAVQRASKLVDSVADILCKEIYKGQFCIEEQQKPLKYLYRTIQTKQENTKQDKNKRAKSVINITVDLQMHKQIVKKFIKLNKRATKNRRNKSLQMDEQNKVYRETEQKSKQEELNRVLEQRRNQIQKRKSERHSLLKQIQQSHLQSNEKIKSIRKSKFLYQQKQQQFKHKYLLPKFQNEQKVLAKKRELRIPMNMSQILTHQEHCKQTIIKHKINKQIHNRLLAQQWKYQPPEFVPKAYQIVEEEQWVRKVEDQLKQKQQLFNQFKKKSFIRAVDELRITQWQKSKSNEKQIKQKEPVKSIKAQLTREAKTNLGNSYMQQILKNLDRSKIKHKDWLEQAGNSMKQSKKRPREHYELQVVKQQRIQKTERIRLKKINQIIHNNSASDLQKFQKLGYQSQKLDKLASQKKFNSNDIVERNQSASLIINSIHAKLAMIEIATPKH